MFLGKVGGCIGEVSTAALLIGGIYLVIRKVISVRIPLTYILTVAVLTLVFPSAGQSSFDSMMYNVLSGGLFLGAIFMATDYVTTPITSRGQIVFSLGCGILTFVIRRFGAYPEGVSYSILLMNVVTPLIDKWTKPRTFGSVRKGGVQ
jgi:electron transport complex protein RnfD